MQEYDEVDNVEEKTTSDDSGSILPDGEIEELKTVDTSPEKPVKKKSKKAVAKMTTKYIAYVAVFTALSMLANVWDFSYGPNNAQRIGLVYFINFAAGAFMGPVGGFITGVLGDFLGFLIKPSGGAYNPVIMIVSGMSGLIPGLVFLLMRKLVARPKWAIVATVVSMVLVYGICSSANTICIYYYFTSQSKALPLYFGTRMMWQLIPWAVNLALCLLVYFPLKKVIKWK